MTVFSVMATVPSVVCRGPGSCRLGARLSGIAAVAVIVGLTPAGADPQSDGRGDSHGGARAVIELFTSQGCSSCPAADKLMSELQSGPFIPLTLAIDYWDYLGWKDTLALPGHRSRQKAYAQMRGDRDIYTPQAVINGVAQAIGSDRTAIANALAQSYANAAPLSVPVSVAVSRERVEVALPERPGAAPGEVWLCPLSASVAVGIGRGENRGRTVTYTNVVRRWIKLGSWSGHGESFSVPVDALTFEGIDSVVVIVQNGSQAQPGAIVGASLAALRQAAE